MIRYLKHDQIDKNKWDDCISSAENGLIYALSWYLDVVSPNWDALVAGDYKTIMPLTWKKKFGFKYLVQPVFCQQLGVFGREEYTETVDKFIQAIPGKFLRTRINLNSSNSLKSDVFDTKLNCNIVLDLNLPYSQIFQNFSTITKKNIKTGRNRRIEIKDLQDTSILFKFLEETNRDQLTIEDSNIQILKKLVDVLKDKEAFRFYAAISPSGLPCSVIFLVKALNRWILLLTRSNADGRKNRGVYLLLDHFLQEHANKMEILDFEGSNIKGVAEFFKGFGAVESNYLLLHYSRIAFL